MAKIPCKSRLTFRRRVRTCLLPPPAYNILILNNEKAKISFEIADKWAGLTRRIFSARPCALDAAGMAPVRPVFSHGSVGGPLEEDATVSRMGIEA